MKSNVLRDDSRLEGLEMMSGVEIIWNECGPALKRFIRRRVPNEAIADDIFQDVFLKIHAQLGTLRDEGKVRPWIYQITRHTIVDYYRSRKPLVELPDMLNDQETDDSEELVDRLTSCLHRMVDRLPDRYRVAVVLTTFQGLTQKEMGDKLGLSPSGAKSRVQRAREKLKDMLFECCHFEQDPMGKVIDYHPRRSASSRSSRSS